MMRVEKVGMMLLGGVLIALQIWWMTYQVRKIARRRKVRREMAERGEPLPRRWRFGWAWLLVLGLITALGLLKAFRERIPLHDSAVGLWVQRHPNVSLFGAIFICVFTYARIKTDRVIFRAYKMADGGRREEALAMLRHKMTERPKAVRAGAMGWILVGAERYAEAAEAFATAESMEPGSVMYTVERAMAMGEAGQGEAALAHLQALRSHTPDEGAYALAAAGVLERLGRMDEAREQFRQAEDLLAVYSRPQHAVHTVAALRKNLAQRLGDAGGRAFEVRTKTA